MDREDNIFFFYSGNGPLWFLTALFVAFVWTKIYFNASPKNRKFILFLYILLTFLMSELPILLPWSIDTSFAAAIFILFGFWLKEHGFEDMPKQFLSLGLICLLPIYMLLIRCNGHIDMYTRVYGKKGWLSIPLFFIISMIYSLICFIICKITENTYFSKILAVIGKRSLTILWTHLLIYYVYLYFYRVLGLNMGKVIMGVTGTALAIIGGLLFSLLCEEAKRIVLRYSKKG